MPNGARENRMGTRTPGKLLLEFSVPAIIAMVFNALYNVIDSVFLGQAVGYTGIAVTTLAMPIMIILMGFSSIAGQGGNALAAIQLGEGKKAQVERTLGNSTLLLIVLALLVLVGGQVLIAPMLALVGTTQELYEPTKAFVQIICTGFIFQSLGMGLNNFLRTASQPNRALYTNLLGTLSCIAFNFLFVMYLGMGVRGSAYATVLGQFVGMLPVVWYFCTNEKAPFRLHLRCLKPDLRLLGQILTLGLASFVMEVASSIVAIVLNQLLVTYGAQSPIGSDGALSAIGVVQKVGMFAAMALIGLSIGAQPLIGYNYGAQHWHRVIRIFGLALLWAVIIGFLFWMLIHLIPTQIVSLFGVEGDLSSYTVTALKIYTSVFPVVGFQIVGSSYFQSSGQPIKSATLSLTRQVIFLLPYYAILPWLLPSLLGMTSLDAIVVATPAADVSAFAVTGIFVALEFRRLKRLRAVQTIATDAREDVSVGGECLERS